MVEKPSISHEQVQAFYDGVYYRNATRISNPSRHLRSLVRRLGVAPGQRIIDVGCGSGAFLLAARRVGSSVAGVDLSHTAIALCAASMPDGEFALTPAETLPFPDGRFDWVVCLGSLEHFLDPDAALEEMVRVANDNARFVLLVPNADFLTRRLGLYRGTDQIAVKEELRTLEGWRQLFERNGLVVEQRWKDLHILSWAWIGARGWSRAPLRAAQALALVLWPLRWQYQVYHLCRKR